MMVTEIELPLTRTQGSLACAVLCGIGASKVEGWRSEGVLGVGHRVEGLGLGLRVLGLRV